MVTTPRLALALAACGALSAQQATEAAAVSAEPSIFHPAFQVEADGAPIACVTGHAAPFVTDFDGDGVWDLAVGQFGNDGGGGGGTCRIYQNVGTADAPRFGAFSLLRSEGKPASMESS